MTPVGTVSVASGLPTVTGAGTAFTADMVGKQFRISVAYPTYTISQVPSPTLLVLDRPWIGPTLTGQSYFLFQCYFPVPADFNYFIALVNTTANYRLDHNSSQVELDTRDPQRTYTALAFKAAFYDYSTSFVGTVGPILQVRGTGPSPVSATSYGYNYPADSIYTVEITTGGAIGTAEFKWKQDAGAYTLGVVTDPLGAPLPLSNGVEVYFPAGVYVVGDVFIIRCTTQSVMGVPRYELWPRPAAAPYCYPFSYISRAVELTDDRAQLPNFVRGDVLLEMAQAECARWSGSDADHKNPGYDLARARQHDDKAEKLIYELELKDDDVAARNLRYQDIPLYSGPWMDGDWLQKHALYPG